MVSAARKRVYTEAEYLLLEEHAEQRSEFFRGEIFGLAGGSVNHSRICQNVVLAFRTKIRARSCETFGSDMRLVVKDNGLYTYPDAMVVCGKIGLAEGRNDTVTNPVVIVEVLSPSTAEYDRAQKFELYRRLDSLRDYVLIHQDRVFIEHFHKQESGGWLLTEYRDLSAELFLESIDCTITIAELYARVDWLADPNSAPDQSEQA